jgi:DNA-binding NtrC family response regulator
MVRDLNSTNHTKIGRSLVTEATLEPGATLTVGDVDLVLRADARRAPVLPSQSVRFGEVVGPSLAMRSIFGVLERIAGTDATVLLEGETGTGKDLIARAIHGESPRKALPFVVVDCGAVSYSLIESELFGHERGAFTGAVSARPGAFENAGKGTLFLDEVGELPLDVQVKLLRALQESEIDPVGGKRPIKVDVRIVSATNRDLSLAVKDSRFREDLFYRLNVFPIEAPALRERKEDVPALVEAFVRRFNVEEGKSVVGATPETLACLSAFDWPGNVRQLENAVYRAIVLADAPYLQPHDFPAISGVAPPAPAEGTPLVTSSTAAALVALPELPQAVPVRILDERGHLRTLEEIERDLIQLAIEIYAGHMSEVARRLGIGRSTLYRKVREQGLEDVIRGGEAAGDDITGDIHEDPDAQVA